LQAVIFDLDGVLVASNPLHWEAFRRTFAAEGKSFTFEDYRRVGAGAAREAVIRSVLGEVPPQKLAALMDAKEQHVRDCLRENGVRPVPGAVGFLRAVRQRGLKTAVATASRMPQALLEAASIREPFDAIIDRAQVERPKPFPDLYQEAARKLNVKEAACLVIEDSPLGIDAALASGMRVIALTTTAPRDKLGRADLVVSGFREIDLESFQ
jgi:HAD superfamily hydrolase (TIGR01509 family)